MQTAWIYSFSSGGWVTVGTGGAFDVGESTVIYVKKFLQMYWSRMANYQEPTTVDVKAVVWKYDICETLQLSLNVQDVLDRYNT